MSETPENDRVKEAKALLGPLFRSNFRHVHLEIDSLIQGVGNSIWTAIFDEKNKPIKELLIAKFLKKHPNEHYLDLEYMICVAIRNAISRSFQACNLNELDDCAYNAIWELVLSDNLEDI